MKNLLAFVFVLIAFVATAQKQDTVTQVVKLTDWQEKQLLEFESQKKRIEEHTRLLWLAILDANKVDEKSILKVEYRPGEFVIKRKP